MRLSAPLRSGFARKKMMLEPSMRTSSAAMAICGRIARLPAHEIARPTRFGQGRLRCASRAALRMRVSMPAGASTSGRIPILRVARRPDHAA